jgi:hypothetical protein
MRAAADAAGVRIAELRAELAEARVAAEQGVLVAKDLEEKLRSERERSRAMGEYPKRIPRARAEAALDLANAILDLEDDLLQLEQPGDLNEGMEDGTTTVERDIWLEWVALARKAVGPAVVTVAEARARVAACNAALRSARGRSERGGRTQALAQAVRALRKAEKEEASRG